MLRAQTRVWRSGGRFRGFLLAGLLGSSGGQLTLHGLPERAALTQRRATQDAVDLVG
jgi:hypothetical protein